VRLRTGRGFLVGAIAVLSTIAACGSDRPPSSDNRPEPSAGATPDAELPPVEDIKEAGGTRFEVTSADWIQVADGSAWATLAQLATVRLQADSGKETVRVPSSAESCTAMDVGFGSLWVGSCSEPAVIQRIDLRTGKEQATIRLPGRLLVPEGSLGAGEGAVWAVTAGLDDSPGRVMMRIDPATNLVTDRYRVHPGVAGARAGLGGVWLSDPTKGGLHRVDPRTGRTVAFIKTGAEARFLDVGVGSVWVQNNMDGTVTRVDPATNKVVATIQVDEGGISGGDLAVGGGQVWARVSSALVAKIDPGTNTVVARYGPAGGSGSVAADDSAAWITAHDINAVYRLPLG
jgi:virginiamycin B lyase